MLKVILTNNLSIINQVRPSIHNRNRTKLRLNKIGKVIEVFKQKVLLR
jgi:hypothetical protein